MLESKNTLYVSNGYQTVYQDILSHGILFEVVFSRLKGTLVWLRLQKTDGRCSTSSSDVLSCPSVLFFLAVVFLHLCFRAIVERASIFVARK